MNGPAYSGGAAARQGYLINVRDLSCRALKLLMEWGTLPLRRRSVSAAVAHQRDPRPQRDLAQQPIQAWIGRPPQAGQQPLDPIR